MREIKFRAWDKNMKVMIYFSSLKDFGCWIYAWYRPDRYILMQYTGLKDKDKVEIYEGDIVNNSRGRKQQIHWDDEPHGEPCMGYELDKYGTYEIIGNIHKNPELWKQGIV